MARGSEPLDLGVFMGVAEELSIDELVLYIPSKDRRGNYIFQAPWIDRGLRLLAKIGGGATRLPPAEGVWENPETGELLLETVVLIYAYIDPEKFDEHRDELREFLHSMGKETEQGEVVFEFLNRLYKIREFTPRSL